MGISLKDLKENSYDRNDRDDRRNDRRDNDNRNKHHDKNRDNRNNNNNNHHHNNNNNKHGDKEHHFKSPLAKVFSMRGGSAKRYSSKQVKEIVMENGIGSLLNDLKTWKKGKGPRPEYALNAIRDIMFASVLEKAIKQGKKDESYDEKDLSYLYDEILNFLHNMSKEKFDRDIYDKELIKDMEEIYVSIIYKANKKKVNKLVEKVKGMTEATAKKIVILTGSSSVRGTIYNLLNFLYYKVFEEGSEDAFSCSNKNILKLLEVCYGEENMQEVLLYLLLENNKRDKLRSESQANVWSTIDEVMRKELEKLSKKELKKIFTKYADIRHQQEVTSRINRRLGDRRTIHPDDYPKITEVFEELENDDVSLKRYFR